MKPFWRLIWRLKVSRQHGAYFLMMTCCWLFRNLVDGGDFNVAPGCHHYLDADLRRHRLLHWSHRILLVTVWWWVCPRDYTHTMLGMVNLPENTFVFRPLAASDFSVRYNWYHFDTRYQGLPADQQTEAEKERTQTWLVYSAVTSAVTVSDLPLPRQYRKIEGLQWMYT